MNKTDMFTLLDAAVESGDIDNAMLAMQASVMPDAPFFYLMRLSSYLERLDFGSLGLKPIRIGLVGSSTMDQFAIALRIWLVLNGFSPDLFVAQFNAMEQTVLDPNSELYAFEPDVIWIFSSYRDHRRPDPADVGANLLDAVNESVDRFSNLWDAIQRNSSAYIFQNNADIPAYRTFGNYEGNVRWSDVGFLREVNRELVAAMPSGGTIVDIDYISSLVGKKYWFDDRFWFHSKHAISLDAASFLAYKGARLIAGLKGQSKKCLVLDLDNTLWGGVIGDDGLEGIKLGSGPEGEAFVAFQEYVLSLKKRGVVLAVCSKNEEENAKLPFLEHPDMRLKLDDIAVFVANWDNKADNIRHIADTLDLGLDSFVFVDDNPAERKLVKDLLPMLMVPELPSDPAGYVAAIDGLAFFETVSFSAEDGKRAAMYRENAKRNELKKNYTDLSGFLQSLEMESRIGRFEDFSIPRISQLINKSNQFHLTTTRYTEAEIRDMRGDEDCVCMDFTLTDRFGDNGLICVVILRLQNEKAVIDTWVMSCRVLSREMENFVYNVIRETAVERGCKTVVGIYKPTPKNKVVSGLYEKLGFSLAERTDEASVWIVDAEGGSEMPHSITQKHDGEE